MPSKNFFDPMPKSKVKTVRCIKSAVVKTEQKEAINSFKEVLLQWVKTFENESYDIRLHGETGVIT